MTEFIDQNERPLTSPEEGVRLQITTYPDRPGQLFLEVAGRRHWIRSQSLFEKCGLSSCGIHRAVAAPSLVDGPDLISIRQVLALKHLRGTGVEIGALNNPILLAPDAMAIYCDIFSTQELMDRHPTLNNLTDVDFVDDGESLSRLHDESIDFIASSLFLECTENPIGTLRSHLGKLKSNGIMFYCVSNKRRTSDRWRPLTDFEHLIADDLHGPEWSRRGHLLEYARLVDKELRKVDIETHAERLLKTNCRIRFHAWDPKQFFSFIFLSRDYLIHSFEIVELLDDDGEMVAVLRKKLGEV